MTYAVHSCFATLQGEGVHTGTPATFIRFSGCNYWSGKARHKATSECPFCDTDFVGTGGVGGGRYSAVELAGLARSFNDTIQWVVCTGGEPLLQLDRELVDALHQQGFKVAVETNGSVALDGDRMGIDWVCCSPKSIDRQQLTQADELKLIYPAQHPVQWQHIQAPYRSLQPMDGAANIREQSTKMAIRYVLSHPGWRLSVQTHKDLGLP